MSTRGLTTSSRNAASASASLGRLGDPEPGLAQRLAERAAHQRVVVEQQQVAHCVSPPPETARYHVFRTPSVPIGPGLQEHTP